eukprot:505790_1
MYNAHPNYYLMYIRIILYFESIMSSEEQKDYEFHCIGEWNHSESFNSNRQTGIILMGGGANCHDGFRKFIEWSGCGNILVIRANNSYNYRPYLYSLKPCKAVATLIIWNKNGANADFVTDKIKQADGIFLSGGNTTKYLQDWQETDNKLKAAVQSAIDHGVPIAGTSAGAMLLADHIYRFADDAAVISKNALNDPYNDQMMFNGKFVRHKNNLLCNVIIDAHFKAKNRFGRLIAFLARLRMDGINNIKGIGIMEATGICIDLKTNVGTVVGKGSAYILTVDHDPDACRPKLALTYKNVNVQKLVLNDAYDFKSWNGGQSSLVYKISVNNGVLSVENPYYHLSLLYSKMTVVSSICCMFVGVLWRQYHRATNEM